MEKVLSGERRRLYLEKRAESLRNFAPVSQESLDTLMNETEIIEVKKNTVLQAENTVARYVYVLLEGVVREHTEGECGEDINVLFHGVGSSFGSFISIQNSEPALYSITSIKNSVLSRLDGKRFFEMVSKHPDLDLLFSRVLQKKYIQLYSRIIDLLKKDIEKQLIGEGEISKDLIKQIPSYHLASYLRLTPESLSRIRARLRK